MPFTTGGKRVEGIGGRNSYKGWRALPVEEALQFPINKMTEFAHLRNIKNGFIADCPFCCYKKCSFKVINNKFKSSECDKKGSSIDFIQEMYGMGYMDAVKKIGSMIKDLENASFRPTGTR